MNVPPLPETPAASAARDGPEGGRTDGSPHPTRVAMTVIVAVAAWAGWTATGYGLWQDFEPGPGFFPLAAAIVAAGFAAAALAASFSSAGTASTPPDDAPSYDDSPATVRRRLAGYVAVLLGWPLLLQPAGFLLSGGLALVVLLRLAEGLSWPRTLAFTAAALAASWALFERLLGVGLPKGLLAGLQPLLGA